MGAGQIGGIATLLDIDLENAGGFVGKKAEGNEARYIVYFLSHAMLFCTGALIEAHIVITPASCVFGENRKFQVTGGSHKFLENIGVTRVVEHICLHRAYNRSKIESRRPNSGCSPDNIAMMVLAEQYQLHKREPGSEYVMNRIRYGSPRENQGLDMKSCQFYGWGSRRNGYLVPLLINLRRVDITLLTKDMCNEMWNKDEHFLCVAQFPCKSEKFGALCPDDVGSVIECAGFMRGLMTSRIVDRPCGVGFLDMNLYLKFITCGVDGARDIIEDHGIVMDLEATGPTPPSTTAANLAELTEGDDEGVVR